MPNRAQHVASHQPAATADRVARSAETNTAPSQQLTPYAPAARALWAIGGILARLQPKLAVNKPGDVYEQEADRVADAVMSQADPVVSPSQAVLHSHAPAPVQRKCAACEEEDEELRVQRKESSPGYAADDAPVVEQALNSPGQPLDRSTRSLMEVRFGHGFRDVRVHTGAEAAQSAHAIAAKAYTVGHQVVFNDGQYKPWTPDGQRLLAHELAHVLQQRGGGTAHRSAHSDFANHAGRSKTKSERNTQALRIPIHAESARRIAREEDEQPWWKKKLNPIYQAALEKLPKEAAEKLKQANDVAKQFVQSRGLSDEGINEAVQVAEPVLKPVEDYLGVTTSAPPPPKKEDKVPTVWLGQPPIDVRLQQRREQKAAQDQLDRTEPGTLSPPIKYNATQDVPQIELKTPDDPGVTTLPDGQKVVIPPKPPTGN